MIKRLIKKVNRKLSNEFIGSSNYWRKSPSSFLLYKGIQQALSRYAKGGKVLDAGAGRLAYRELLLQYFDHYSSLDFKKTHDELDVVGNVEMMPFENNSFDMVLCSQVLEHVAHPWRAFEEIYRVLKPGGKAIITVPMLGYIHNAPHDFFRFTRFGLKSLAKESGFSVINIRPLGGFFAFLGYIRSTILMPLFGLPIIGGILLTINYWWGRIDIKVDEIISSDKILSLNYLIVLGK
jgi:SAM-dependent methyltransferase